MTPRDLARGERLARRDADRAAAVVVVLLALALVVSLLADGCGGRLAPELELDAATLDASARPDVGRDAGAIIPRDAGCDVGAVVAFQCDCRVGAATCPAARPCGVDDTCRSGPFVLDRAACTIHVREAGLADCVPRDDAGGLCCPTWDGWDGGL